jgi:hypothetical protein
LWEEICKEAQKEYEKAIAEHEAEFATFMKESGS